MDLAAATELFCESFAFTRSFTHPYVVERHGRLLVMRDAPRKSGSYRKIEVVATQIPVDEVLSTIAEAELPRSFVCAISPGAEVDESLKVAYKSHGYRLMATEQMMVAETSAPHEFPSPAINTRIATVEEAESLARAAGSRQILARHLIEVPPRLRQYVASMEDAPVGWVRSVQLRPDCAWVSNMYVKPSERRKGIGKALLGTMLADDHRHGAAESLLLASHAGARLYPLVGYRTIGILHLFASPRSRE